MFLPAWELSNNSSRVSWTFEQASENSLQFVHLLTLLIPKFFGAWTGPGSEEPAYWLEGPSYGYYTYWDTSIYVGVLIWIFALAQLVKNSDDRFVRFATLWWIVTFLFALGSHSYLYGLFFEFVPGFDRFRSPGRVTFTWAFLLPILAARTFEELRRRAGAATVLTPLVVMIWASLIMAFLTLSGVLGNLWPDVVSDSRLGEFVSSQGWVLLVNVGLAYGALILLASGRVGREVGGGILILVLAVDLFIFGYHQHVTAETSPASYYATNAEDIQYLKEDSRQELFRVNSRQFDLSEEDEVGRQTGMIFGLNQGMVDQIQLVEGFYPLQLSRRLPPAVGRGQYQAVLDLLNVKYYVDTDHDYSSPEISVLLNSDRMPRARMFYRARVLDDDDQVVSAMTAGAFDYRTELLLTESLPFSLPAGSPDQIQNSVEIQRYSANRIDLSVSTEENGVLWLSEIWYPAWKAYVDGEEVEVLSADFSFRAIPVGKGSHTISFVFDSGLFRAGGTVALITILGIVSYFMGIFDRLSSMRADPKREER